MEEKGILKQFGKYVSLNVMGMVGLSCYILADTFFVARGMGADGLTALNLAIPIYSFIHGLGLMIGMGGATRYAISKGNGEKAARDSVFTQAAILTAVVSSLILLLGIFGSGTIAAMLGADEAVFAMTNTYLKVILVFAPMFMMNNLLICFIRNDGNPKLSMAAMLIGSFSNIILDYVFVFPCNMGIFGAAFATGLAPVISMTVLSLHFIQKKNGFRIRRVAVSGKRFADIASLGSSALIVEVSSGITMIVFNSLLLGLGGNLVVAAYGIVANVALVVISIFTGIAQGIQPMISRDYGKGNGEHVKKAFRYALTTSLVFALCVYGISFVFAEPIVSVFNKDGQKELADVAVKGLRIYFTAFFFTGVNIITAAYLSAVAKAKPAFLLSSLRGIVLILPIAVLLAWQFGIVGVWMAVPLTELIVCVAAQRFFPRNSKR